MRAEDRNRIIVQRSDRDNRDWVVYWSERVEGGWRHDQLYRSRSEPRARAFADGYSKGGREALKRVVYRIEGGDSMLDWP